MGGLQRTRTPELDGVRGVAILLVIVSHGRGVGLDYGGPVGVTLFFVLSGYLITGSLVRELDGEGRVDLGRFWARRARRIVPALVLPVAVGALITATFYGWRTGAATVALLRVANYAQASGVESRALAHMWSLAGEEQFYLFWPLIIVGIGSRFRQWVAPVAIVLLAWRVWLAASGRGEWAYFSLEGNSGALLAGAALAVARMRTPRWTSALGLAGLVGLSATAWVGSPLAGFVPSAAALCALLLVAGARGWRPLASSPLRGAGRVSYGWYLWHFPFTWMFPTMGAARWVGIAVALLLAAASWRLIERPFMERGRGSHLSEVRQAGSVDEGQRLALPQSGGRNVHEYSVRGAQQRSRPLTGEGGIGGWRGGTATTKAELSASEGAVLGGARDADVVAAQCMPVSPRTH